VIPLTWGLLSPEGHELAAGLHVMKDRQETFCVENIAHEPVPSLLRGFSAPVILDMQYSDTQLRTLLAHDGDPFNRWEAAQRLWLRLVRQIMDEQGEPGAPSAPTAMALADLDALRGVLRHPTLDAAFKELVLSLPSETYLAEQMDAVDPQRIHAARETLRGHLASALHADWEWAYHGLRNNAALPADATSSGRRALAGLALSQLCLASRTDASNASGLREDWPTLAYQHFVLANNMTERIHALTALVSCGHDLAAPALKNFHAMFQHEALVLDKWFAMQAAAPDRAGHVLPQVRLLMKHPDFNLSNPNRARSLIFSYCIANPGAFHRHDAAGYVFWSERVIELDAINPQVAARLARALDRWSKLVEPYRSAAREAIARVAARVDLSNDVREVVSRALAD
jgi:aminopeptidase N